MQYADVEAIIKEREFLKQSMEAVAKAAGVETPMQLTALAENDEETTSDLLGKFIAKKIKDLTERTEMAEDAYNNMSRDLTAALIKSL